MRTGLSRRIKPSCARDCTSGSRSFARQLLKYDALLTVDCDGLSIHSLFLFKTTLKFKANNNVYEVYRTKIN